MLYPTHPKKTQVPLDDAKPSAIPGELRQHDRFVLWARESRHDGDSPTKIPYSSKTLRKASSTDPATWASFATTAAMLTRHAIRFAGLGFVLGDDAPFVGIDLDDCRNPDTGAIVPRAQRIIDRLNTYAEISPSLCGVKLIGTGKMPTVDGAGKNYRKDPWQTGTGGIEFYRRGRFFTLTGNHLPGTPTAIRPVSDALANLYQKLYPQIPPRPQPPRNHRMADDSTAQRCSNYLARLPASVSGSGRHGAMLHAACVCLRFGVSDADALNLLRIYNDRALPPWDERDVVRKLSEAHKLIGADFGSMGGDRVLHPPSSHPITARWRTFARIGGAS